MREAYRKHAPEHLDYPPSVAFNRVVHSHPNVSSGTPVFRGTRVPAASLFDHLAAGDTIDRFLEHFPSVSRKQALAALDLARDHLLARAHSA